MVSFITNSGNTPFLLAWQWGGGIIKEGHGQPKLSCTHVDWCNGFCWKLLHGLWAEHVWCCGLGWLWEPLCCCLQPGVGQDVLQKDPWTWTRCCILALRCQHFGLDYQIHDNCHCSGPGSPPGMLRGGAGIAAVSHLSPTGRGLVMGIISHKFHKGWALFLCKIMTHTMMIWYMIYTMYISVMWQYYFHILIYTS